MEIKELSEKVDKLQSFVGTFLESVGITPPVNADDKTIEELDDGVSFQDGDELPVARGDSNVKLSKAEILAAIPEVAGGLSPYESTLDDVGTLPNHYVNLSAAYAANKPYTFTIANIVETSSITMSATDQIYLQVGQNFSWNLVAYQIIGSSGNSLSLVLADGSAVVQYAMTGTNIPFDSFDANSTIMINGNGGTFINTSAVDDTFIYSPGILSAYNIKNFLLPNASGGGFKTSGYTVLFDIHFVGGGSACEKPIIANGGFIQNIVFKGTWKTQAVLAFASTKPTNWDSVYVDIDAPVTLAINGKASKITTNTANTSSFLTVPLSTGSEIENSNIDECVLLTGITNCKIIGGNCGSISLANDNTTQVYCDGVTFTDAVQVYGYFTAVGCTFLGGITLMSGAVFVSLTGNTSSTALVDDGALYLTRSSNDANIGNNPDNGGISPFDGILGVDSGDYATPEAAYAANKNYLFSTANITSVAPLTLTTGKSLYFLVGDSTTFDLNSQQISSTAAVGLKIELESANTYFKFGGAAVPFNLTSGDSGLIIEGNGGYVLSVGETDPSGYVKSAGTLIIKNCIWSLPVLGIGGGIETNKLTLLDNINFMGQGTTGGAAIITNGGFINNTVINGNWPATSYLTDVGANPTQFTNMYIDISTATKFKLFGQATNFYMSAVNPYLAVETLSNSSITNGYFLTLILGASIVDNKFVNCDMDSITAADNTVEANFTNCTFSGAITVKGLMKFNNCKFLGNLSIISGATAYLNGCICAGAYANSGTAIRAGNDGVIGNDGYRAWARFSSTGGTITIAESYNILSITLVSAGIFDVVFINDLGVVTYAVLTYGSDGPTGTLTDTCRYGRCGPTDCLSSGFRFGMVDQALTGFSNADFINFFIP